MKKDDVWDEEINPDGISTPLNNLNVDVWDRGYFFRTEDGIWYEVYVNEQIKTFYPSIDNLKDEAFSGFNNLMIDNYVNFNQITFFVPNKEETFTLDTLTDILI